MYLLWQLEIETSPWKKNLLGNIQEIISFYYLFMSISSKLFSPHKLLSHTYLPVYHSASNIFFFLFYIYMGYFSYAGSSFIKTCILAPGIGNTVRFPIPFVTSGFLLLVHNRHMIPGGVWTFVLVASRMIRCPHTSLK